MEDPALIQETKEQIIDKLMGKYGCKRFLRDGYQTIKEVSISGHLLCDLCIGACGVYWIGGWEGERGKGEGGREREREGGGERERDTRRYMCF